jgi:hypothetical protein
MGKIFSRWIKRGGWNLIAENKEGLWILEMKCGFGEFEFEVWSLDFGLWSLGGSLRAKAGLVGTFRLWAMTRRIREFQCHSST